MKIVKTKADRSSGWKIEEKLLNYLSSVLEAASTISNMVAPRPRIWSCLLLRWKRFGWYPWVGWQHPYSLTKFAQESLNHVQHNIWPVHDQPSFTGLSNGWQGIFSRFQARPPPLRSRQSCLAVGFDTDSIEEQQGKIFFGESSDLCQFWFARDCHQKEKQWLRGIWDI